MYTKEVTLFGTLLCVLASPFFQGINGRTSYDLAPVFKNAHNKPSERVVPPSSTINESQQTTGSVSGFVNSTAEGNGQPNSAVAYAWQGGQTSAHSTQTATADNSNATAETAGVSTCLQGYQGTAGGANANSANSVGNALCNATYNQEGQHSVSNGEKFFFGRGKPPQQQGFGPHGPAGPGQYGPPQVVTLNYTVGQTGEAQSGQTHNSISQAGGPTGGLLSILAGGFANIPQGQVTFQQSAIDSQGKPIQVAQDLMTDAGLVSEEQTLIAVSGGQAGHNSGGLAHVYGLGNMFNTSYNSHAEAEEEAEQSGGGWSSHRL